LPEQLDGGWTVQQIAGAPLGLDVRISLTIDARTGAVSGFTGCNNFTTKATSLGRMLAFTAVEEDQRPCPSAEAATDEARFLKVLPYVQHYARHGKSLRLMSQTPGEELILLRHRD
jgi:heat shock protein HslJ